MPVPSSLQRRLANGHSVARCSGAAAALLGTVVLAVWATGLLGDSHLLPRPSGGVMFVAAGLSLHATAGTGDRARRVQWSLAMLVFLIGLTRITLRLLDTEGTHWLNDGGALSPVPTAIAFGFVGLSLLTVRHARQRVSYVAALAVAVVVVTGTAGSAIGLRPEHSVLAGMSPTSFVGLAVLAAGLVSLWPQLPPLSWITTNTAGSRVARRLVPAIIAVPLLLGVLSTRWEQLTGMDSDSGAAVVATVMIVVLTTLVAVSIRVIDRGERATAAARGNAERAVRESELRFRSLAMEMPAGIVGRDETGAVTFANAEALRIFGLPLDTPNDALVPGLAHPDDRSQTVARMQRAIATQGSYEEQVRLLRPSGEVRWVLMRGTTQLTPDGAFAGYLATFTDITDSRAAQERLAQSEELHRLTVANIPGVIISLFDRDLRCLLIEGAGKPAELTTEVCRGQRLGVFTSKRLADRLEAPMHAALEGQETVLEYESRDQTVVSRFVLAPLHNTAGEIDGVLFISSDITEQRRAELAERRAADQFRAAFDDAPIGMGIFSLEGRLTRVNQALTEATGYSAEQLAALPPYGLIDPDDLAGVQAQFGLLGRHDTVQLEHRIVHADGLPRWCDTRATVIRDDHGALLQVLAQLQDISARRAFERQLQHMAHHDPLTGLFNRRGFETRLDEHLARARRYGTDGALLMLDLDGFKAVNDTLGHAAGDALIVAVAEALTQCLRETDTVGRLGGDEFAVVLPDESAAQAFVVAQSLVDTIRTAAASGGLHDGAVTASIGVAALDPDAPAAEVIRRGDAAMYRAKVAGKDRVAREI